MRKLLNQMRGWEALLEVSSCCNFMVLLLLLGGVLLSSPAGEKYIHQGILFKFAVDVLVYSPPKPSSTPSPSPSISASEQGGGAGGAGGAGGEGEMWMYGGDQPSDEAAQHVAANELRGFFSFLYLEGVLLLLNFFHFFFFFLLF